MLLNLASVVNAADPAVLWGFISRYAPGARPDTSAQLAALVERAVAYYQDFVRPAKRYRLPDARERRALDELATYLDTAAGDAEALQNELYDIGRRHGFEPLRGWFQALYEVLLGQSAGPRFGTFIAVYGVAETRALIRDALAREAAA
jgi:lysyl-tRNA synthetase class 1